MSASSPACATARSSRKAAAAVVRCAARTTIPSSSSRNTSSAATSVSGDRASSGSAASGSRRTDGSSLSYRIIVADEAREPGDLVVEDTGAGVVLLGQPVEARTTARARRRRDRLDQRPRRALAAHGLVDEQVGEIADIVEPDAGVEQIMGDADHATIETGGKAEHFLAFHEPSPGAVIVGVGQHPFIKGVVAHGERLPARPVGLAKR